MNTEIIVWLALVVVFVLVELATTALVSIWMVAGAVVALIVSLFTDSWVIQFAVFAAVSAIALIASRPLVRRLQGGKAPDLNTGLNIGGGPRGCGWSEWSGARSVPAPWRWATYAG